MVLEQVFVDTSLKRLRECPLGLSWMVSMNGCINVDLRDSPFVVTFQTYPISVAI